MADEKRPDQWRSTVRTMKTDIDELTKKESSLFLGAVAKGVEARSERGYIRSEHKSYAKLIGILALVFIMLPALAGGMYYAISRKSSRVPGEKDIAVPRPLIQSEKTDIIKARRGDRTGLIDGIKTRQQAYASSDQYIYTPLAFTDFTSDQHIVKPAEFLSALRTNAPTDFTGALAERWNTYIRGGSLIFVFETSERMRAWGGLLRWEGSLVKDLAPFLPEGSATVEHKFEDAVVKNNDVRIARLSETQDAVVAYSIVLGKFIVLSTSEIGLRATIEYLVADPSIR